MISALSPTTRVIGTQPIALAQPKVPALALDLGLLAVAWVRLVMHLSRQPLVPEISASSPEPAPAY